jgi:hypothetical protein
MCLTGGGGRGCDREVAGGEVTYGPRSKLPLLWPTDLGNVGERVM